MSAHDSSDILRMCRWTAWSWGMDLDGIRQFERDLDRELDARPTLRCGVDALVLALKVIEAAHRASASAGRGFLRDGLSVLASRYVTTVGAGEPDVEDLARDLLFGFHYYMLRDYLYYRYNKPNAVSWQRTGRHVSVTIADRSLPRQFFHTANRWFVQSTDRFEGYDASARINELLTEAGGSVHGEIAGELAELIMQEVDLKLSAYYDLLHPADDISLGSYTYADFYQVFRQVLGNALVHRYISRLEDNPTVVTFSRQDLAERLSATTRRSIAVCRAILTDMVFDEAAVADRLNAVHFGLFATSNDGIVISPTDLLLHEGLVSTLRVVAQRRPDHFLARVSGPLGDALTRRVCAAFNTVGLLASHNVSLSHIDRRLPDIDVLAVSEERTLGYVVYVIETKNPLPPQWAKDQLRAIHKDNIPKAVTQLQRLLTFFGTPEGAIFLRDRLPRKGLPRFGHEFIVLVKALIVTSDSVGMLMDESPYPIIDYRTLERILARADGDVVYINWALGQLDAMADQGSGVEPMKVRVGGWDVTYEGVTIERLAEFGVHSYRSAGIDRQLADDFIAAGHHPHDVLITLEDTKDDGNVHTE